MTNGNDPINPVIDTKVWDKEGLTKREYIATAIMQGLVTNSYYPSMLAKGGDTAGHIFADEAVEFADDLIRALNK